MDYCPGQCQPNTLFSQCVRFIAENIHHVESFIGFPSQIGEVLFRATVETAQFQEDASTTSNALTLFAETFNEEVLSSLNLSGQHLALNYHLEQIILFTSLVSLDVSNCGLGDHHEILTHFSQLNRLKTLVMKKNALSDTGIQKMTTPYRMFGRGPSFLTHIDLSGNPRVTASCLKYLTPFSQLSAILLNNCKVGMLGDWKIKPKTDQRTVDIQTEGWASSVICYWVNQSQAKIRRGPKDQRRKSWFYSRSSQILPSSDSNQRFDKGFDDLTDILIAERCVKSKSNNEKVDTNSRSRDTSVRCYNTASRCMTRVERTSNRNNSGCEMEKLLDLYRGKEDDISADIRSKGRTLNPEQENSCASARQSAGQSHNNLLKSNRVRNESSCGHSKVFSNSSIGDPCYKAMGRKLTLLGRPKLQSKQCAIVDTNATSGNCTKIGIKRSLPGDHCSMTLTSKPVEFDNIHTIGIPRYIDSSDRRHYQDSSYRDNSDNDSSDRRHVNLSVTNAESSRCLKRRKIVIHGKRPWSSVDSNLDCN